MVSAIHEVNQWGRKDPFTPATTANTPNWNSPAAEVQIYKADGIAITKGTNGIATIEKLSEFKFEARTTTNQTTINDLIQNPSTHYDKGDGTNHVPIASTTDLTKDWWNPTIKTIYDPCPNGYRIPEDVTYGVGGSVTTHKDWSDWISGGLIAGRTFKESSFFPASGLRNHSSGLFYSVGAHGYYWMSTPSNITIARNLTFTNLLVAPSNGYYNHSYGFPTRCIKEQ